MEFKKSKSVSLRTHPIYNEKWLQGLLAEDPTLLGLGDLVVKDIERRQPRAGRLDLLLSDPETHTRYEVEIQLGPTDETHIIRTIEYWDIEKSRYPQYEHVAVIVAEDITSRFLNVINLFNKTIPLIAIQMRALDVGGVLTLSATKVLDLMSARDATRRTSRARPPTATTGSARVAGLRRDRRSAVVARQRGHAGDGAEVQQALHRSRPRRARRQFCRVPTPQGASDRRSSECRATSTSQRWSRTRASTAFRMTRSGVATASASRQRTPHCTEISCSN